MEQVILFTDGSFPPLLPFSVEEHPRHTENKAQRRPMRRSIVGPRAKLMREAYHARSLAWQPRRGASAQGGRASGPRHCYFGGSLPDQPISRAVSAPTPSSANESGGRSEPTASTRLRVITSA